MQQYLSLYREFRPSNFDDVITQIDTVKILKNQLESNKISHAYIFSGPRGVGKTSIAKIFAKAVNCTSLENKPCNKCLNCNTINEDRSIDFIEMDAASHNGVDDIRELNENVKFSPANLKYKVMIIDEVHMLSKGAFNALLKTLEEPPVYMIFILATTEIEKIPATIISRCQKFEFNSATVNDLVQNMEKICKLKNVTYEKEALDIIAKMANGGVRDSLSLLEQVMSYCDYNITVEYVNNILNIVDLNTLFELLKNILNKDYVGLFDNINLLKKYGKEPKIILTEFSNLLSDVIKNKFNVKNNLLLYSEYINNINLNYIILLQEYLINNMDVLKFQSEPFNALEIIFIKCFYLDIKMSESDKIFYLEGEILKLKEEISNIYKNRDNINTFKSKNSELNKIESIEKISSSENYQDNESDLFNSNEEYLENEITDINSEILDEEIFNNEFKNYDSNLGFSSFDNFDMGIKDDVLISDVNFVSDELENTQNEKDLELENNIDGNLTHEDSVENSTFENNNIKNIDISDEKETIDNNFDDIILNNWNIFINKLSETDFFIGNIFSEFVSYSSFSDDVVFLVLKNNLYEDMLQLQSNIDMATNVFNEVFKGHFDKIFSLRYTNVKASKKRTLKKNINKKTLEINKNEVKEIDNLKNNLQSEVKNLDDNEFNFVQSEDISSFYDIDMSEFGSYSFEDNLNLNIDIDEKLSVNLDEAVNEDKNNENEKIIEKEHIIENLKISDKEQIYDFFKEILGEKDIFVE